MACLEDQPTEDTDEELCAALAAGDQTALGLLYDRHGTLAYSVAVRITASRETAEDVVQQSFVKLWMAPDRFVHQRGAFRPWLLQVVRNMAIDQVRRAGAQPRLPSAMSFEMGSCTPAGDPFDEVARRATAAAVRGAVDRLPAGQREVVEMAYFGGRSLPEIAAGTSLPVTTVKGRMRLALEKMRRHLLASEHAAA